MEYFAFWCCSARVHFKSIADIFINHIFHFIEVAELLNFLDYNTIPAFSDSIENKITKIEEESSKVIKCLRFNEVIVNPVNSQSIAIDKQREFLKLIIM